MIKKTLMVVISLILVLALSFMSTAMSTASADVVLDDNVILDPSGVDTNYTIENTVYLSNVTVKSDYILLDDHYFKAINGTNVTVGLQDYNYYRMKFTASADSGDNVSFTIGGFKPNREYNITVDSTYYDTVLSDADGKIDFHYSSWSSHTFTVEGNYEVNFDAEKVDEDHESVIGIYKIFPLIFMIMILLAIVLYIKEVI